MDQSTAKKILQELVKRADLSNKACNDCSNPNPQWASLSFAVFLCLQCAGTHRGFGVHVSFVRSISMDTWQDEQIKRMQLGGNGPFREFMHSYTPVEQGGYKEGLSSYDTYHCWAATQYREKLDAALAGKPWSPSPAPEVISPPNGLGSPARPSSAQGLRKSRTSTRSATNSSLRNESPSPASFTNSTSDSSLDQKTANENFFASLGQANAARPMDLPPSQGGRYQGFGNTPSPSQHPSFGLSSGAVPSFSELQENPMAALNKGWSLFSAAVTGATRVVSENIIQPGMEKVNDPNMQASVKGYMSEAQRRAIVLGSTANQWSKNQFGIDVADSVGGVVGTVKDKISGGPTRAGYGQVSMENEGETSALYQDNEHDFFREYSHSNEITQTSHISTGTNMTPVQTKAAKNADWDDEWKDF